MRTVASLSLLAALVSGCGPSGEVAGPHPTPAPVAAPEEVAASGAAPGALSEVEWGKEYQIVVLLAQVTGDATAPIDAATRKAASLGVPEAAIGQGLDCGTGVSPESLGVSPDATVVYARFDTEAHARAFADRFGGGPPVVSAIDACGG